MTTKREWVLKAFKNEKVDRVPVGFWYHFTTDDERSDGFNPVIFNKNIAGHKRFISDVDPDFVKIMSDGFFTYPNEAIHEGIKSIHELEGITSIGENHPWITKQVELAKKFAKISMKILHLSIISLLQQLISNGILMEKVAMGIKLLKILSKKIRN